MLIYNEIIKYFKMNLKSFIILTYLKTLRLYSTNNLSLKFYNKDWFIGVGGSLFSVTLNSLIGTRITKKILTIYDDKNNKYEIAKEIMTTSLSILYVLILRYLYMKIFFQKDILSGKYVQITIISILSIAFYTVTIKPFFNNTHHSRFINSIISDSILLLSSDFIQDGKFDNKSFDIQVNTLGSFFRIIINSLIKI